MKVVAAIVYLGVIFGVTALVDAGVEDAVLIWSVASFILGWITRSPWMALMPLLLAGPMAAPFGYPAEWSGRDALPLWFVMSIVGIGEAVIVLVGFGVRRLYDRSRRTSS